MKKILFLSYMFPPVGGVGRIRPVKFIKYLPQFGYETRVLTVKNPFYSLEDKTLLNEIPAGTKITRVDYTEPARWISARWWQSLLSYLIYPWLLFPDSQILWFWSALRAARQIIKTEKIDLILTSSSPISDHFVAYFLSKMTKIPWVADFRDEWTINPTYKFPTPLHLWLAKIWEKKIINQASQVTMALPKLAEQFKTLTPQKDKFTGINNGFDPEYYSQKISIPKHNYCHFLFAGRYYPLDRADGFKAAIKKLNLAHAKVTFLGQDKWVSHPESVKAIRQADILLLILNSSPRPAHIPSKFYEYLAARKPILALAPDKTHVAQLIKRYQIGEVVDPLDQEGIEKAILSLYQKWEKGQLAVPQVNIDQYDRKKLTQKLAQTFDQALDIKKKIKVCLIGNLQSSHNINAVNHLKREKDLEIHFITPRPNQITGIKTYTVAHPETKNIFQVIANHYQTIKKIRAIVQKIQPDIIHGQSLTFFGIWAYLAKIKPLVVSIWGSDVNNYEKYIWPEQWLIRQTLRHADLILTNSMIGSGQKAIQFGADPAKMRLLQFGIDLDIFKKQNIDSLRRRLSLIGKKVIFCPRSIQPVYNIDVVIASFIKIAANNSNLTLALMTPGADSYGQKIKAQIKTSPAKNQIIFLPRVTNREMARYYNLADVIVSIASSEGNSSSFMEALACEKKMVVTNLPVLKEWPGKYWRVPVRDVPQTVQKLEEALEMPDQEFAPLGRKNRALVAAQGEVSENFHRLADFYREIV